MPVLMTDFVFSESCSSSPVLLILLSPDQWVIHPDRTEVMSADRSKLIFSCSIPLNSILNILPSELPPSLSPGASLNGFQCLHFVTSCRLTHSVSWSVMAFWFVSVTLAQPANLHRCHAVVHGRCASSAIFVWVENYSKKEEMENEQRL